MTRSAPIRSEDKRAARAPRAASVDRTTPRTVPGVGLGALLRTADQSFNRALRDRLARHDVSFSEFQHLWQLFGDDGITQADLSRRIGIETASSTHVIEQLAGRKLILRTRDPQDRRRIRVTLTAAGRALEADLTAAALEVNALARRGMTKAELTMLFDLAGRVTGNLRKASAK